MNKNKELPRQKFQIGDSVFIVDGGGIVEKIVSIVRLSGKENWKSKIIEDPKILYGFQITETYSTPSAYLPESRLFKTKEELISSL